MALLKCSGWWEQAGYGRQSMDALVLEFESGSLQGGGVDLIGEFHIQGEISGDSIVLRKQYIDKHLIVYRGTSFGEGIYGGKWFAEAYPGGDWSIKVEALEETVS